MGGRVNGRRLLVAGLVALAGCAADPDPVETPILVETEPRVRVLLSRYSGVADAALDAESPIEILAPDGSRVAGLPAGKGTALAPLVAAHPWVRVVPERDGTLGLGGTNYRGVLIVRAGPAGLDVVNEVPMEDYLAGVLGMEMPLDWHEEALGAQAIAARTYALHEIATSGRTDFDVHDTVLSQVYGGTKRDDATARRVIEATRGVYMVHEGRVLKAYFSSTCGGHTESAALVFGDPPSAPLAGSDCGACTASKYHRWTADFDAWFVAGKLSEAGHPVRGEIESIEVVDPGPGGHGTGVRVRTSAGETTIQANAFRAAIGYSTLRSTAFTATRTASGFRFEGRGWGHAVGLCQNGAEGLARRGRTAREILLVYYPGALFQRYRSGP